MSYPRGRPHSERTKQKIARGMRGHKQTPEHKAKISESVKRYWEEQRQSTKE